MNEEHEKLIAETAAAHAIRDMIYDKGLAPTRDLVICLCGWRCEYGNGGFTKAMESHAAHVASLIVAALRSGSGVTAQRVEAAPTLRAEDVVVRDAASAIRRSVATQTGAAVSGDDVITDLRAAGYDVLRAPRAEPI